MRDEGPIPREFRKAIGDRIYGCDDCLAVCPWNKSPRAGRETEARRARRVARAALRRLARLDDRVRAPITKSQLNAVGRDRFVRDVLIAISNSEDAALTVEAERLLDERHPLVRAPRRGRCRS